jgi:hypothetical protein
MFAGQLTSYTTRHTKINYSLAYPCSQVDSPPIIVGTEKRREKVVVLRELQ